MNDDKTKMTIATIVVRIYNYKNKNKNIGKGRSIIRDLEHLVRDLKCMLRELNGAIRELKGIRPKPNNDLILFRNFGEKSCKIYVCLSLFVFLRKSMSLPATSGGAKRLFVLWDMPAVAGVL